jgi:hypothetical protein
MMFDSYGCDADSSAKLSGKNGKAVIDLDFVKYAISSVGEERSIEVTHIPTGKTKTFKTRTEFYGNHHKKEGGWLAETNKVRMDKGKVKLTPDDFTIKDVQTISEPIENILHSAKRMVDSALEQSGASSYIAFSGKGDSFRVELSTLLKYKANRSDMMRPLLLDEVTNYLNVKYRARVVTGYEVDDMVVMETYKDKNSFIIGVDKDYLGAGTRFFNVNRPDDGILDCSGFGYLKEDGKKIRGVGRMFKYFQILSQDTSDNYAANCFSEKRWGDKSAFKALKDCSNDTEAWEALRDSFKLLYPESKKVIGWRGDEIEIDWLYVLQECFNMAHMMRFENDIVDVGKLLKNKGLL